MLRQDDYQKAQLVTVGWRWGREYGGGHMATCLVMGCLMNRVRLGWGSVLEVLDRIPNYAAIPANEIPGGTPSVWEPNFVRLLHEVEGIFDGTQDPSKGAVYWCDLRRVTTPFFKDKILAYPEEHPRLVDMNTLVCFR